MKFEKSTSLVISGSLKCIMCVLESKYPHERLDEAILRMIFKVSLDAFRYSCLFIVVVVLLFSKIGAVTFPFSLMRWCTNIFA